MSYMMHTSYLLVCCDDMLHKNWDWDLLGLCAINLKLYSEIRHLGLMIPCIKPNIWVRNEITINCAEWSLCWMSYCNLCCLFAKLEIIHKCSEHVSKIDMLSFKIWCHSYFNSSCRLETNSNAKTHVYEALLLFY